MLGRHTLWARHSNPSQSRGSSTPSVGTETVADSADQLRLLIQSSTEYAIFLLSPKGRILTWNPGAERLKGYRAEEAIGLHFSVFYPEDKVASGHPQMELERAVADGVYSEEGWRIRKDGTSFWASVTITALWDDDGQLQGFGKVTRDLTAQLAGISALLEAEAQAGHMLDALNHGVMFFAVAPDGRLELTHANSAACAIFGLDESDLKKLPLDTYDRETVVDERGHPLRPGDLPVARAARTGQPVSDFLFGWEGHGETRWYSAAANPIIGPSGSITAVVASMADVTQRYDASVELANAHARYSALVEHSADVICIIDTDGIVRYASPAYLDVYGEPPEERLGRALLERIHPDDQAKLAAAQTGVLEDPDRVTTVECSVVHPDGSRRYLEVTLSNHLNDPAVGGFVTNSRDVTDRVMAARQLAFDAMHDALTGLPNRALLLNRLTQSLAAARRSDDRRALIYLDLDHFKYINDSLGHRVGDEVLRAISVRLVQATRPGDTVARLGGDEFVILIEDSPSLADAQLIADRTRELINQPITVDGRVIAVDCSFGIALSNDSEATTLLQEADTALYKAKAQGRGRWEVYDQAMRFEADHRLEAEVSLRLAMAQDRIAVHFQPIVSLATAEVVGSEALVRLTGDDGRLIPPDQFIPVAEETGLIVPLGMEVLRRACRQQAEWMRAGQPQRRISVNLSPLQLRAPDLVGDVASVLAEFGLPGSALCLELTESALIEASDATRRVVDELGALGIVIALDDFGTGMSSLSHLRQFPIDVVKIDRSFVAGIEHDADDLEVVKAVIGLGLALGMDVVAEGVETSEQLEILRSLGCRQAQGYYYGRPRPAEEFGLVTDQLSAAFADRR